MHGVAIYIRWSTEEQGEGTTLEVQRDRCISFCQSQGWVHSEDLIFVDDGYSGGTMDRPGLTELRALVKAGRVNRVVIYKLDRLSRSVVDCVDLVRREWDGICTVVSTQEMFDTNTPQGQLFFTMMISFAEWERSVIRERTFSGRVKRAAQGRNPGGRLNVGYRQGETPGDILVDEVQETLVLRIFELYANGNGDRTIAALLNAEGVESPRGKQWDKSTIGQLLVNERYIGIWTFGHTRKNERHGKAKGQPLRVVSETPLAKVERPDLAIVPFDLWERCQVVRQRMVDALKTTSGRAMGSGHLLSGLARCRCGGSMRIAMDGRSRKGEKRYKNPYYYFRCAQRENKGEAVCDCGTIAEKDLNEFVIRVVKKLGENSMQKRLEALTAHTRVEKIRQAQAKIATATAALTTQTDQLARIRRDYRADKLDVDTFNEMRREIEGEQALEQAKIAAAEAELAFNANSLAADRAMLELANQAAMWDELELTQQKLLLRRLIESLTIYRKRHSAEPIAFSLKLNGIPDGVMDEAFSLQKDI